MHYEARRRLSPSTLCFMSPRIYGVEYPERELMFTISQLLDIPHFPTANGSTVKKEFLAEAAKALGIFDPEATKNELLAALWEHTNDGRMPMGHYSPGSTVKNEVLDEIASGIVAKRLGSVTEEMVEEASEDWAERPDLDDTQDTRRRAMREVAIREGQSEFRAKVLAAYSETCAVTKVSGVPQALEASHIARYNGPRWNFEANGLCLRRDIHTLFDRGLLGFHEDTHELLLSDQLKASAYNNLAGSVLNPPSDPKDAPWGEALRAHRDMFDL